MIQFSIKGKVVKGRGVGAQLGIPTANIKLNQDSKILEFGVFAGWVIVDKEKYKAAIFIGPRLTFDLSEPMIEVALINFSGDLYGKEAEVKIGKKIRKGVKFRSVDELKKQILEDIKKISKL